MIRVRPPLVVGEMVSDVLHQNSMKWCSIAIVRACLPRCCRNAILLAGTVSGILTVTLAAVNGSPVDKKLPE